MTDSFPGFSCFFELPPFVDLYADHSGSAALTVIIPAAHVNELWKANLLSIYRECPVYELIIGDAGLSDADKSIARSFPRVKILDHVGFTLGYSIRLMLQEVSTPIFAYFHSDVFLPKDWYASMMPGLGQYDWFGCSMVQTTLLVHKNDYGRRPYAGAQIGRKDVFDRFINDIEDDYVWRQEDFVFAHNVEKVGGSVGAVPSAYHYHQLMPKPSGIWNPELSVSYSAHLDKQSSARVFSMQLLGLLKYTNPNSSWCRDELRASIRTLISCQPSFFVLQLPVILRLLSKNVSWICPFFFAIAALLIKGIASLFIETALLPVRVAKKVSRFLLSTPIAK